ncbi:STAS/SEC14 domain-containing protein [uncultured Sulfitobacter sp.]|uniref:STAS/SEC14 domain-containing protein n=1 Tax=uncultured Sulfitobacter sp. TaxID=191468 RepID=UPI00263A07B5|nr:STAS/SEC14 domain-containing protein [uncultured Sulfitobacter sp.]
MTHFKSGPITEIPTDTQTVHAFRVSGHIDDDASEAMAEHMNAVFDRSDKVNMLLDLTGFTGSDWDSMLDGDVITSRLRALRRVHRYAVVGAPDRAAKMINLMDKIIPVEAKAFDAGDAAQAWEFVGAKPLAAAV